MRIIRLSVVLPVLSLVSANMDLGERREDELVQLVARQRSSGVLGPLVGDDEEETTSTTASTVSTTTAVAPTRPPTTTTSEDDDTPTPTTNPTPVTSAPTTSGTTRSSSSETITEPEEDASASSSISSSSSTSSEPSTSSQPPPSSNNTMSVEPSTSLSVDAGGETVVVTVMQSVVTESVSRSSAAVSASPTPSEKEEDNDGLAIPLGAVIGISVGAGVVVLLLIGLAIWRMKRKTTDEDEAIRWPELNRHGDSDAHHALPAHQTGKHGIETSPLERSLSNSSSMYHGSSVAPPYGAEPAPMALNGSGFGASSTLDDEYYQEKTSGGIAQPDPYAPQSHAYDLDGDYASYPPAVQPNHSNTGVNGAYDQDSDDEARGAGAGGGATAGSGHVTYPVYR